MPYLGGLAFIWVVFNSPTYHIAISMPSTKRHKAPSTTQIMYFNGFDIDISTDQSSASYEAWGAETRYEAEIEGFAIDDHEEVADLLDGDLSDAIIAGIRNGIVSDSTERWIFEALSTTYRESILDAHAEQLRLV